MERRVANPSRSRPISLLPTLSALELALRDLGAKGQLGAGVAAAQTVFADTT